MSVEWKRNILVVASETASSPEFLDALSQRAREHPTAFTLVCPVAPSGHGVRNEADLAEVVTRMRDEGLEVESATLGRSNPAEAVDDVFDRNVHDEILISTLPAGSSRWLALGAPQQIQRRTGATVSHLVGSGARTFC